MRILITGCQGQIGWELVGALGVDHEVIAPAHAELDLRRPETIGPAIVELQPDVIINTAAYTTVDRAELEPDLAEALNVTAVAAVGEAARSAGAAVVHFSTDYVFNGAASRPYRPADLPEPLSVYGRTKLAGEQALTASGARSVIFRTAWVYGLRRRNFLMAMLSLGRHNRRVRVVNDQIGSPTWSRCVARAVTKIINEFTSGQRGERGFGGREGIYHLTCAGSTTWCEFAQRIFDLAALEPRPEVVPISTTEYGARAQRPAYSVLDCTSTRETFGIELPHWEPALQEAMDDEAALAAIWAGDAAGVQR